MTNTAGKELHLSSILSKEVVKQLKNTWDVNKALPRTSQDSRVPKVLACKHSDAQTPGTAIDVAQSFLLTLAH